MTGWTLFFTVVGVAYATSWLFKLLDRIEGGALMGRYTSPKPYVSKSAFREARIAYELTNRAMPKPRPRPVLGSRVTAIPVLGDVEALPQRGTVTYIHDAHQWYEVTFDAGYRNCYKWGDYK